MSIKRRSALSFGFIFLMLVVVGIYQYNSAQTQIKHVQEIENTTLETVLLEDEIKLAVVQVQQYLTDIGATRGQDGLDDGFDLAENYSQIFYDNIEKLKQLQPEDAEQLADIQQTFDTYYASGQKMAANYIEGGSEQGNKIMGEFDATSVAINEKVDAFLKENKELTKAALKDIDQSIDSSTRFFMIMFSVAIIGGIVIAILLSSSIIKPLMQIICVHKPELIVSSGFYNWMKEEVEFDVEI